MPVEGFPDASRHRLCVRCKKWHEPDEGILCQPEEQGTFEPFMAIFTAARAISGLKKEPRFICYRCLRVRRYIKVAIFGTLALLIALALVLERLGLI